MPETRQFVPAPESARLWLHGGRMATHRHPRGQLIYPSRGILSTTTESGVWITPANRVSWTPAGFDHEHRAYGETDVRTLLLPKALSGALPDRPTVFAASPLLRAAVLRLTGPRRPAKDAALRLRRVIVDELLETPEQPLHLPRPRDDRLRAVTDLLHTDPADGSSLTELGRVVGAGERTLSRLFHAELGMSFHQWRAQLRVQHALVHLMDGRSVTRTSSLCGWANTTSFIDAFTAILGQTPGRYQASLPRDGFAQPEP
ncbi:AraC family transcriptional regulator [Nocardia mexicana]|uniref:HTH-type transcriptional regulator RipA n=1 Tax=Nocardia mexicana TaxID=279262 RepID=A0A370GKB1_9NOCA|nr:helix-turn-helix transcriptional regulator [Nocardia mexicana]RDI43656.1 AraC-like DNA-binding protein [Nocardia mexicana]